MTSSENFTAKFGWPLKVVLPSAGITALMKGASLESNSRLSRRSTNRRVRRRQAEPLGSWSRDRSPKTHENRVNFMEVNLDVAKDRAACRPGRKLHRPQARKKYP